MPTPPQQGDVSIHRSNGNVTVHAYLYHSHPYTMVEFDEPSDEPGQLTTGYMLYATNEHKWWLWLQDPTGEDFHCVLHAFDGTDLFDDFSHATYTGVNTEKGVQVNTWHIEADGEVEDDYMDATTGEFVMIHAVGAEGDTTLTFTQVVSGPVDASHFETPAACKNPVPGDDDGGGLPPARSLRGGAQQKEPLSELAARMVSLFKPLVAV